MLLSPSLTPPLTPLQITPGSKASVANLCPGDLILAIEGVPATDMLHSEAQNKIKESTNQLCLTVERLNKKHAHKQVQDPVKATPAQYRET